MNSLSLIHAIVLLQEKERLSEIEGEGQIVRSSENLNRAIELACESLGRNLKKMPRGAQILFLLIEEMRDRICEEKRISFSAFRFTRKDLQAEIGWNNELIYSHLNFLEAAGYVEMKGRKYQILLRSQVQKLYRT